MSSASSAASAAPAKPFPVAVMVAMVVALTIALMPLPDGLTVSGQRILAILAFVVIVWLTEALDYAVSSVVLFLLTRRLIPPEKVRIEGGKEAVRGALTAMGPMTAAECRVLITIALLIGFWVTEKQPHAIDTTTVTIVGLALLFLPKIGVMTWPPVQRQVPWDTIVVFGVGHQPGHCPARHQGSHMAGEYRGAGAASGHSGQLRRLCRSLPVPDPHSYRFCQRHFADFRAAADHDRPAVASTSWEWPCCSASSSALDSFCRSTPSPEHGLPRHRNLHQQAIHKNRPVAHRNRLCADAGFCADLEGIPGLRLRSGPPVPCVRRAPATQQATGNESPVARAFGPRKKACASAQAFCSTGFDFTRLRSPPRPPQTNWQPLPGECCG